LKFIVDLMNYFDKVAEEPIEGTVTEILGKPSTTIDDWMKDKRNAIDVSSSN